MKNHLYFVSWTLHIYVLRHQKKKKTFLLKQNTVIHFVIFFIYWQRKQINCLIFTKNLGFYGKKNSVASGTYVHIPLIKETSSKFKWRIDSNKNVHKAYFDSHFQ